MLPTRNFASGAFEGFKSIDGDTFHSKYVGKKSCFSCPLACKKKAAIKDERFTVDPEYGSPEYETVGAFGSNVGVSDANVVIKANELCNRYGLDTISTGVTIAFAMECFEKGIITKEQTGGLDLKFGNAEAMLETIELIARKEGFGKLLAEGTRRVAQNIGKQSIKYAVQAKGLELAMHDPRAKYTVGIGYAIAAAGPHHMSIPHDTFYETVESIKARGFNHLTFYEPIELLTRDKRKVKMAVYGQMLWSVFNVLGVCVFGFQPRGIITLDTFVQLVKAITGFDTNLFDLLEVGRRSINMARIFNFREGMTKEDDMLPPRAFEPIEEGRLKGVTITKEELEASLRDYYLLMGWDPETGYPLPITLDTLDLAWTI